MMPLTGTESRPDEIVRLADGSLAQHGPYNDRIYLMKLGQGPAGDTAGQLLAMARQHGYAKIFAKIPAGKVGAFTAARFEVEALIPGFYGGREDGALLGCYLDAQRRREPGTDELDAINALALDKAGASLPPLDPRRFSVRRCREGEVERLAALYGAVFASYPFPIHEPDYLLATMRENVDYFCIEADGEIIALASSEMDRAAANTEMTDFATLPGHRGHSLAAHLLRHMETAAAAKGIKTAYTIARAASPGMNITFARLGYRLGGRLKNNTNIAGRIESMNVWHKRLAA